MASFIYSNPFSEKPFFLSFVPGYRDFVASEGIVREPDETWSCKVLLSIPDGREARRKLNEGISLTNEDGLLFFLKRKKVFIIEKIQVFCNDAELKGHEFVKFRLSF